MFPPLLCCRALTSPRRAAVDRGTEIFSQFPLEPPCPLLLCRRGLSGRGGPAAPDPDRLVEGPAPGAEAIHIVVIPLSAVLTVNPVTYTNLTLTTAPFE